MEAVDSNEEDQIIDLAPLCRVCAQPCSGEGRTPAVVLDGSHLSYQLHLYLNIQVEKDPPILPRQLCESCLEILESWRHLQEMFHSARDFYGRQLELRSLQLRPKNSPPTLPNLQLESEEGEPSFPPKGVSNVNDSHCQQSTSPRNTQVVSSEGCEAETSGQRRRFSRRTLKKSPPKKRFRLTDSNPIQCALCECSFELVTDFQSHLHLLHLGRNEYQCGNCFESFSNIPDLLSHSGSHLPSKKTTGLICDYCGEDFKSNIGLISHVRHQHGKTMSDTILTCGICKNKFVSVLGLKEHLKSEHSELESFPCSTCDLKFGRVEALINHELQHKNNEETLEVDSKIVRKKVIAKRPVGRPKGSKSSKVRCQKAKVLKTVDCRKFLSRLTSGKKFNDSKSEISDPSGQNYICGSCTEKFPNFQTFVDHFPLSHPTFLQLPCGVCGAQFSKLQILLRHEYNHKTMASKQISFTCQYCKKCVSAPKYLLFHTEQVHKEKISELTSKKSFDCKKCEQKYKNFNELHLHQSTHTSVKCPICYETVEDWVKLRSHVRIDHQGFKNSSYQDQVPEGILCTICGKVFKNPTCLKVHMEGHSSSRNYVCEICAKSYRTYQALYNHKRTHETPKYQCDFCQRYIRFKFSLKSHIMNHIGDLPFRCEFCGQGFSRSYMLKTHKLQRHDEDFNGYSCLKCNKAFKSTRNWRRHMLRICNIPQDQIPYTRDRQFVQCPKPPKLSESCVEIFFPNFH